MDRLHTLAARGARSANHPSTILIHRYEPSHPPVQDGLCTTLKRTRAGRYSALHRTIPHSFPTMFARVGLSPLARPATQLLRPSFTRAIKTIPEPAGGIIGTVNDAYIGPSPVKLEGSYHWTSERLVSIGLIPLVVMPLAGGEFSSTLDTALASMLLVHCHAGFQACITDYIPKRTYGSIHSYAMLLLTFGTGVAGYGIYNLEQEEGLTGLFKRAWKA